MDVENQNYPTVTPFSSISSSSNYNAYVYMKSLDVKSVNSGRCIQIYLYATITSPNTILMFYNAVYD